MFKITDSNIQMTRGDVGTLRIELTDSTFQLGQKVLFEIYEAQRTRRFPSIAEVYNNNREFRFCGNRSCRSGH